MNIFWTDQRVAELRRLAETGLSCRQIACEIGGGVSRNAVIGKLVRLGINRGHAGRSASVPRTPRAPRPRRQSTLIFAPTLAELPSIEEIPAPFVCANRVPLLEAQEGQCRWPAADDGSAMMVCGNPKFGAYSYCAGHCRIAYIAPQPRRRTAGERPTLVPEFA